MIRLSSVSLRSADAGVKQRHSDARNAPSGNVPDASPSRCEPVHAIANLGDSRAQLLLCLGEVPLAAREVGAQQLIVRVGSGETMQHAEPACGVCEARLIDGVREQLPRDLLAGLIQVKRTF